MFEAFTDDVLLFKFTDGIVVDARNFEFAAWTCTSNSLQQNTIAAIPFANIIIRELDGITNPAMLRCLSGQVFAS